MNFRIQCAFAALIGIFFAVTTHAEQIISANFQQTKILQAMGVRLESSGNVRISPHFGLLWKQEKPFESTLILNNSKMSSQVGSEKPVISQLSALEQVQLSLPQLLGYILQNDVHSLSEYFAWSKKTDADNQTILDLTPRNATFQRLFRSIRVVKTDPFIKMIRLTDNAGDITKIVFSHSTIETKHDDEARNEFFIP